MNHRSIRGGIAAALAAGALLLGTTTPALAAAEPAPAPTNQFTPFCQSAVWSNTFDGSLTATTQCRIQGGPASSGGYTGIVDGAMGNASWRGLQAYLRDWYQYRGPVDGVPGTATYAAMQRLAQHGGYTGPIDGVMGPNSWIGLNRAIRTGWFGPLEPAAGDAVPAPGER